MANNSIPVAAPIDSDSAGRGGATAINAVMRVICPTTNSSGTGFLHKSGKIITAEHVVRGVSQATLLLSSGAQLAGRVVATDQDLDLALIDPATPITVAPLQLAPVQQFAIGAHVSTWGFPGGYLGYSPMLSAGYLSAITAHQSKSGKVVRQWVVNAAFNSGNSGGPLLLIETGEVIGVASSKLAPISQEAASAIEALETNRSGVTYSATNPDGTTMMLVEGQIVAMVLQELRRQVQLVIGHAVLLDDVHAFLKANGVIP